MQNLFGKIKTFFKSLYDKLAHINDSPQKIALGFGLGVFLGILPGSGPVAALALSFLFKVNRVAALAGSLLTNSWLSVVTFVLAVKIGSALTDQSWVGVYDKCKLILQDFHLKDLQHGVVIDILKPLAIGYVCVGLLAGVFSYLLALGMITGKNKITGRNP